MAGVVADVVVVAVAGGANAEVVVDVEGKDVTDDGREDDIVAVVPAFCSQGFGGEAIVPGLGSRPEPASIDIWRLKRRGCTKVGQKGRSREPRERKPLDRTKGSIMASHHSVSRIFA